VGHFVVVGLDRRRIACYIFDTPAGTGFILVMPFPEIVWLYFQDSVRFIEGFTKNAPSNCRIIKVWNRDLLEF